MSTNNATSILEQLEKLGERKSEITQLIIAAKAESEKLQAGFINNEVLPLSFQESLDKVDGLEGVFRTLERQEAALKVDLQKARANASRKSFIENLKKAIAAGVSLNQDREALLLEFDSVIDSFAVKISKVGWDFSFSKRECLDALSQLLPAGVDPRRAGQEVSDLAREIGVSDSELQLVARGEVIQVKTRWSLCIAQIEGTLASWQRRAQEKARATARPGVARSV